MTAGVVHACALEDGVVRCWGDDSRGQLGRGAPSDAVGAPEVVGVPPARALDAGGDTTCAVDDDGGVWCFGANDHGQLGDALRAPRGAPALVDGLGPMVDVSVGHAHACALDDAGDVWCWGWNGSGQSIPGGPLDVDVPARVEGLPPAREVVAGYSDSCAITLDDRALCWGALSAGLVAERIDDARALAIGADHVCVSRTGEVRCFGAEPGGARPPLPAEGRGYALRGGALASALIDHVCATDDADALYCWGKNEAGQLGDSTLRFATEPTRVRGITGPVRDVATGYAHTCAVAGGEILCWGANDRGQLGEPGALPSLDPVAVP